jgi:hypothetical protein
MRAQDFIDNNRFKRYIRPLAGRLSAVLAEIDFAARLEVTNQAPHILIATAPPRT